MTLRSQIKIEVKRKRTLIHQIPHVRNQFTLHQLSLTDLSIFFFGECNAFLEKFGQGSEVLDEDWDCDFVECYCHFGGWWDLGLLVLWGSRWKLSEMGYGVGTEEKGEIEMEVEGEWRYEIESEVWINFPSKLHQETTLPYIHPTKDPSMIGTAID